MRDIQSLCFVQLNDSVSRWHKSLRRTSLVPCLLKAKQRYNKQFTELLVEAACFAL